LEKSAPKPRKKGGNAPPNGKSPKRKIPKGPQNPLRGKRDPLGPKKVGKKTENP